MAPHFADQDRKGPSTVLTAHKNMSRRDPIAPFGCSVLLSICCSPSHRPILCRSFLSLSLSLSFLPERGSPSSNSRSIYTTSWWCFASQRISFLKPTECPSDISAEVQACGLLMPFGHGGGRLRRPLRTSFFKTRRANALVMLRLRRRGATRPVFRLAAEGRDLRSLPL